MNSEEKASSEDTLDGEEEELDHSLTPIMLASMRNNFEVCSVFLLSNILQVVTNTLVTKEHCIVIKEHFKSADLTILLGRIKVGIKPESDPDRYAFGYIESVIRRAVKISTRSSKPTLINNLQMTMLNDLIVTCRFDISNASKLSLESKLLVLFTYCSEFSPRSS